MQRILVGAAALLLSPLLGRAADPFTAQPRVLELLAGTLRAAPEGPAGAGSAERRLAGVDSRGLPCEVTLDQRRGGGGRSGDGYARADQLLVVQLAVGSGVPAYAGAALFSPEPSSRPAAMRPVRTELSATRVTHEERDAFATRRTTLELEAGALRAVRQTLDEGGRVSAVDCLGLRAL